MAGPAHRTRGFTLIELLIALSLMALMAVISWRGLDGMQRAQTQMRSHADDVLALQAALGQWTADLDAMVIQPQLPSLEWDGRGLRVLRRSSASVADGLVVVAWARRNLDGKEWWLRWQSPALTSRADVTNAWQRAAQWAQNPGTEERKREVAVVPLESWQIFYFRGNGWANPLSSGDASPTAGSAAPPNTAGGGPALVGVTNPDAAKGTETSGGSRTGANALQGGALPDGIRLILTLPPGQTLSGALTKDWVRPVVAGAK